MGLRRVRADRQDPGRSRRDRTPSTSASPGKLWSDSDERGVYKTTDGGKTWTKVLKGCKPLHRLLDALDGPARTRRRSMPACGTSAARAGRSARAAMAPNAPSGSGLFKSTDGGATWTELDAQVRQGPPAEALGPRRGHGRAVEPETSSTPFIEAVLRRRTGSTAPTTAARRGRPRDRSQNMVWRPFYFANLIVDPKDENRIYKPDLSLIASTDGGRSFSNIGGGSARRLPRPVDRSARTPTTSSPATTAASGTPTTAATAGGRATTCRSPSSTT